MMTNNQSNTRILILSANGDGVGSSANGDASISAEDPYPDEPDIFDENYFKQTNSSSINPGPGYNHTISTTAISDQESSTIGVFGLVIGVGLILLISVAVFFYFKRRQTIIQLRNRLSSRIVYFPEDDCVMLLDGKLTETEESRENEPIFKLRRNS